MVHLVTDTEALNLIVNSAIAGWDVVIVRIIWLCPLRAIA